MNVVQEKNEGARFDPDMIETWNNMKALRNAIPIHPRDQPISALEFFKATFPVNHQQLWDNILDKFLDGINRFVKVLAGLPKK